MSSWEIFLQEDAHTKELYKIEDESRFNSSFDRKELRNWIGKRNWRDMIPLGREVVIHSKRNIPFLAVWAIGKTVFPFIICHMLWTFKKFKN